MDFSSATERLSTMSVVVCAAMPSQWKCAFGIRDLFLCGGRHKVQFLVGEFEGMQFRHPVKPSLRGC